MSSMLKHTLSMLTLVFLCTGLATPMAAQTADEIITNFLENTTTKARVLDRNDPNYTVEIDGRVVVAKLSSRGSSFWINVQDEAGNTVGRIAGDDKTVTLSDGRGNSLVGPTGRLDLDAALRLFDPALLFFADAGLVARVQGQRILTASHLAWGQPTVLDLCCDAGSVSNCFPPGPNGSCGEEQDLVACPNGNCEINGTWNCC